METRIIKGASIEAKREILAANKGQYFTCRWTTKKGEITERTLKEWQDNALVYGKENVQPNAAAHNPDNFTAVDPVKKAAGHPYPWVNVTLSKLERAQVGGIEYLFQD